MPLFQEQAAKTDPRTWVSLEADLRQALKQCRTVQQVHDILTRLDTMTTTNITVGDMMISNGRDNNKQEEEEIWSNVAAQALRRIVDLMYPRRRRRRRNVSTNNNSPLFTDDDDDDDDLEEGASKNQHSSTILATQPQEQVLTRQLLSSLLEITGRAVLQQISSSSDPSSSLTTTCPQRQQLSVYSLADILASLAQLSRHAGGGGRVVPAQQQKESSNNINNKKFQPLAVKVCALLERESHLLGTTLGPKRLVELMESLCVLDLREEPTTTTLVQCAGDRLQQSDALGILSPRDLARVLHSMVSLREIHEGAAKVCLR